MHVAFKGNFAWENGLRHCIVTKLHCVFSPPRIFLTNIENLFLLHVTQYSLRPITQYSETAKGLINPISLLFFQPECPMHCGLWVSASDRKQILASWRACRRDSKINKSLPTPSHRSKPILNFLPSPIFHTVHGPTRGKVTFNTFQMIDQLAGLFGDFQQFPIA